MDCKALIVESEIMGVQGDMVEVDCCCRLCSRTKYRSAALAGIGINILQQLTGINIVIYFGPQLLKPTENLDVFDHWISNDFTLESESMTSLTVTHEMFAIDSESTIFVTRIFSGNGKVVSVDAHSCTLPHIYYHWPKYMSHYHLFYHS